MTRNLTTGLQRGLRQSIAGGLGAGDIFSTASLDLNFARHKRLDPRVTHTRASNATYVDGDGIIKDAVTNLLLRSEEFNSADWNSAAGARTVAANQLTAPDGTFTADLVTANGTNAHHFVSQHVTLAAVPYSFSVFAKAGTTGIMPLRAFSAFGGPYVNFNLTTGAVTDQINGGVGSIQSYGNGWYRCTMVFTPTAATSGLGIYIDSIEQTTSSNSLYLWGAQLEQSSTAGEYVKTTSTINSAPRFDHNPTTGESLGLLVEESRTNLLTYSEDFSNGAWDKYNTASVVSGFEAPDGSLTAFKATYATQTSAYIVTEPGLGNLTSGYRRSVWAKVASGTAQAHILGRHDASNSLATITDQWQRFELTITDGTFLSSFYLIDFRGSTTSDVDFYFWGAQLEAGSFSTSYIRTSGSTVTRSADVASITGNNYSSWASTSIYTLFGEASRPASIGSSMTVFSLTDGTLANRTGLRWDTSSTSSLISVTANTSDGFLGPTLNGTALPNRIAWAFEANNLTAFANGASSGTDTSVGFPVVNQLNIGSLGGTTSIFTGHIRRLTYWPTRLSNDTLQTITR